MHILLYCPELITDSLKSLAAPKSEKRFRKQVLTEIVCKRLNRNIELPTCEEPDAKQIVPFGKNFALDFLALYELKYAGKEIVEKTVSDIPREAEVLAGNLSLDFYEKMNPKFLNSIPEDMRAEYCQRLKDAGVEFYLEKDWEEFRKVREFLGKYYPIVLR